jgi:hypothetical protein
MSYVYLLGYLFNAYTYVTETSNKALRLGSDIYQLCMRSEQQQWYIMDNGVFATFPTINNNSDCWSYDGSVLTRNPGIISKKLPYLTFEMKLGEATINMDDFISTTKYRNLEAPPLPVLMAAFSIYSQILYPWSTASFTLFNSNGDLVEFNGSDGKIPQQE